MRLKKNILKKLCIESFGECYLSLQVHTNFFIPVKFLKIYITLFFILFVSQVHAQTFISLSNSDNKQLEKAKELFQKAEQTRSEAEGLMNEASGMTDQSQIDKKNKQSIQKFEAALDNFKKANQLFFEVYQTKINEFDSKYTGSPDETGYAKILSQQANTDYQSIQTQLDDAKNEKDPIIKYAKISSFIQQENAAIENLKKSFELYSQIPLEGSTQTIPQSSEPASDISLTDLTSLTYLDSTYQQPVEQSSYVTTTDTSTYSNYSEPTSNTTYTPPPAFTPDYQEQQVNVNVQPSTSIQTDNIYQAVKVNENMIDQFNKFLTETYPSDYEKFVIDFSNLNYSDVESIRNAWLVYNYGEEAVSTTNVDSTSQPVATDTVLVTPTEPAIAEVPDLIATNQAVEQPLEEKPTKKAKTPKGKKSKPQPVTSETSEFDNLVSEPEKIKDRTNEYIVTEGFSYQIQIAASLVPLSATALSAIYQGTEPVQKSFERKWYQYSIGNYSSYGEAKDHLNEVGIEGAFVVAFVNGKKINVSKALLDNGSQYLSNSSSNGSGSDFEDPYSANPDGLVFRLQIAASKEPLDEKTIQGIYNRNEPVEMLEEDGWYKYSVNCGSSYSKATSLLSESAIPGAFIVAYQNGLKISVKEALILIKKQ